MSRKSLPRFTAAILMCVILGAAGPALGVSYLCHPVNGGVTALAGDREVKAELALRDIEIPEAVIVGDGVVRGRMVVKGSPVSFRGFYNAQMSESFNTHMFTHIERDRERGMTTRYDSIQIRQNPATGKIEISVQAQRQESEASSRSVAVSMVCSP